MVSQIVVLQDLVVLKHEDVGVVALVVIVVDIKLCVCVCMCVLTYVCVCMHHNTDAIKVPLHAKNRAVQVVFNVATAMLQWCHSNVTII
jgi:hypothetical protein